MHYVYLLQSESFVDQRYVGMASDLKRRLSDHNSGKSPHTSKFVPWKLVDLRCIFGRTKSPDI